MNNLQHLKANSEKKIVLKTAILVFVLVLALALISGIVYKRFKALKISENQIGQTATGDNKENTLGSNDFFYYSNDKRIPLNLSSELFAVQLREGISIQELKGALRQESNMAPLSKRIKLSENNLVLLKVKKGTESKKVLYLINKFNKIPQVEFATPVFRSIKSKAIYVLTNEFIVQFLASVPISEIEKFNSSHGLEVVKKDKYRKNNYVLRITPASEVNALEMANLYHESKLTEYAHPNFLIIGAAIEFDV